MQNFTEVKLEKETKVYDFDGQDRTYSVIVGYLGGYETHFNARSGKMEWSNGWAWVLELVAAFNLQTVCAGPDCYGHTEYILQPEIMAQLNETSVVALPDYVPHVHSTAAEMPYGPDRD